MLDLGLNGTFCVQADLGLWLEMAGRSCLAPLGFPLVTSQACTCAGTGALSVEEVACNLIIPEIPFPGAEGSLEQPNCFVAETGQCLL